MASNPQNLGQQPPHIIIIPPPFQGHINPSVQLALHLAAKCFVITFVNTQFIHHRIITSASKIDGEDLFARARGSGLDIRYRTISDGFPLSFDRSLHQEQFMMGRIHVLPAHVDEIVGELVGLDPRPACLVADTSSTWGYDVARKYGLVFVSLWTQRAAVLSIYCHVDLLRANDNRGNAIDYIPGVKPLEPKDLMSFLQETDTSSPMHRVIHKAFSDVKKADFILCNTVVELEPEPISALNEIRPTYAIGPLFDSHYFTNPSVEMNLWAESDCARWLATKPHGSVVYVSFGSFVHTKQEDMIKTIANGLMLSGLDFIWALRPERVSSEPDGFRESVIGSRGLVVPWCKQKAILSNSAVGGFLTHCGWNSIMESIWAGVPLICFPSEKLENAMTRNGSSRMNFDKFVEDLKAKMEKKKIEPKMATNKNQKPHAIMVSLHLQGHITPFVNLALKLASNGFTITFAHLHFVHRQISKSQPPTTAAAAASDADVFSRARASGLDIRYTTLSDGLPIDYDRAANFDRHLESFMYQLPDHVDELVGKLIAADPNSDYFLVADSLCIWPEKIARKHNLVNVSFWTEPALVFSLYYHLDLLRENGHVPVNGRRVNVNYIPGIPSINTKDFVSYFHDSDSDLTLLHKLMFRAFDAVKSADFFLCNTVQELEPDAISALNRKHPFYAIGPVLPPVLSQSPIATSLLPEFDPTEWLSSRAQKSVLYVSFGSLAKVDKSVITEIANGLLLSGVDFIWVVRPGITGNFACCDGILPDGFEDSVRGKGLIVPWCDQNRVLSSPAVGGFLTHCGWNSVVESIWYGVPMICYPVFTDQITNRKLVVDDWRVGINLCDGEVITGDEVRDKIGILISSDGERSNELRSEIGKVREVMKNGVSKDGSSERNFASFVEDVKGEIVRRKLLHGCEEKNMDFVGGGLFATGIAVQIEPNLAMQYSFRLSRNWEYIACKRSSRLYQYGREINERNFK
ncbi:UDP-Glycosyltransferase superfamily protein, partial [Striga asiatica]